MNTLTDTVQRISCFFLLSLILLPMMASATSHPMATNLFDYQETKLEGIKPFPQWQGVIEKQRASGEGRLPPCDSNEINRCAPAQQAWNKLITELRPLKRGRQLIDLNKRINNARYILDPINWGREDYWASPVQFFNKDGDCEDFSIVKYFALLELGWPADEMRIVVVHDNNLDIPHAVLAVRFKDKEFILDNQIDAVVQHHRIRHYRPIYSVNHNAWWRHIPPSR